MAISSPNYVGSRDNTAALINQGLQSFTDIMAQNEETRRRAVNASDFGQLVDEVGLASAYMLNPDAAVTWARANRVNLTPYKDLVDPMQRAIAAGDSDAQLREWNALQDKLPANQWLALGGKLGYSMGGRPQPITEDSPDEQAPGQNVSMQGQPQVTAPQPKEDFTVGGETPPAVNTQPGTPGDPRPALNRALTPDPDLPSPYSAGLVNAQPGQFNPVASQAYQRFVAEYQKDFPGAPTPTEQDFLNIFQNNDQQPLEAFAGRVTAAGTTLPGGTPPTTTQVPATSTGFESIRPEQVTAAFGISPQSQFGKFPSTRGMTSEQMRPHVEEVRQALGLSQLSLYDYEALKQGTLGMQAGEQRAIEAYEQGGIPGLMNWARDTERYKTNIQGLPTQGNGASAIPPGGSISDRVRGNSMGQPGNPIEAALRAAESGNPGDLIQVGKEAANQGINTYRQGQEAREQNILNLQRNRRLTRKEAEAVASQITTQQLGEGFAFATQTLTDLQNRDPALMTALTAIDQDLVSKINDAQMKDLQIRGTQQELKEYLDMTPERQAFEREQMRFKTELARLGIEEATIELIMRRMELEAMNNPQAGPPPIEAIMENLAMIGEAGTRLKSAGVNDADIIAALKEMAKGAITTGSGGSVQPAGRFLQPRRVISDPTMMQFLYQQQAPATQWGYNPSTGGATEIDLVNKYGLE